MIHRQDARSVLTAALLSALCVALPVAAHADTDDLNDLQQKLGNEWVLVKNDRMRNIKTWVKQEDGKRYRSFKVEATLDGTMSRALHVLLDLENYNKWYWEVEESRILKRLTPARYHAYLKHRTPHGVPGRDVPVLLSFEPQTASNPALIVQVKAIPELLPLSPPLVRMLAEDMQVKLTPVAQNKIRYESEGYVDPGGTIPGWAINMIQRSAPYSIMLGTQRMLAMPETSKDRTPLPFPVREFSE